MRTPHPIVFQDSNLVVTYTPPVYSSANDIRSALTLWNLGPEHALLQQIELRYRDGMHDPGSFCMVASPRSVAPGEGAALFNLEILESALEAVPEGRRQGLLWNVRYGSLTEVVGTAVRSSGLVEVRVPVVHLDGFLAGANFVVRPPEVSELAPA